MTTTTNKHGINRPTRGIKIKKYERSKA